jgi:dTDP-4-dehydrorhamnose reductase
MTIGVIGGNGFVGDAIVKALKYYSVTAINRENYVSETCKSFDIIINSNGNSHKYWGNSNPLGDFDKSVLSVYKSFYDFNFKKYIYISSIDAEIPKTSYGFHKHLAEELVKFHCKNYSIIRIPGIIGKAASKGVVYDILHGNKIYITSDSTMMLMDVESVAKNLAQLIEKDTLEKLIKFYPKDNITVEDISKFLNIAAKYSDHLRKEYFDFKGNYLRSIDYLKNIK